MSADRRAFHPLALAGFLALAFLPSVAGAFFTPGDWYQSLAKPAWTPPGWLFGPVWTGLYATIGVAAWMVWRRAGWSARGAWLAWGAQLALNAAWSWLFFGLRAPGVALVEIVVLWAAIVATVVAFRRVQRPAGLLLVPYLAWVGFAAVLNAAIWALNR